MKPAAIILALSLTGCACIQPPGDDWLSYDPDDRPTIEAPVPAVEPEEPHEEPREEEREESLVRISS